MFKKGDKVRRKKGFQEDNWWKDTGIKDEVVTVIEDQTTEKDSVVIDRFSFSDMNYHVEPHRLELVR